MLSNSSHSLHRNLTINWWLVRWVSWSVVPSVVLVGGWVNGWLFDWKTKCFDKGSFVTECWLVKWVNNSSAVNVCVYAENCWSVTVVLIVAFYNLAVWAVGLFRGISIPTLEKLLLLLLMLIHNKLIRFLGWPICCRSKYNNITRNRYNVISIRHHQPQPLHTHGNLGSCSSFIVSNIMEQGSLVS